jgi:NitT/TauT family transport system ATP-binding protein
LSIATSTSDSGVGIDLRAVRRVFDGDVVAVESLDLAIAPGEFVAILGPSGSGKSTLLRMIAGLDRPTAGEVSVVSSATPAPSEGATLPYASRVTLRRSVEELRVAYVFQDAHLLPWRDVLRNVALPLELRGVSPVERESRAAHAIEQVGLADAVRRYPAQLSGGMRMRASLARALVTDPELLLLDEPFAALDEITRQHLDDQLRALWADRGMTVLFVTHSIIEAAFLADRAVVLTRRPARLVLDHRLDLPTDRSPALRTDAQFAREMRVLFDALSRGERA